MEDKGLKKQRISPRGLISKSQEIQKDNTENQEEELIFQNTRISPEMKE